jgi:hypothetical protein
MAKHRFEPGEKCQVSLSYEAVYPDPLIVKAGEKLSVGQNDTQWPDWVWCTDPNGKSGWMPESYLDRTGSQGLARRDYDATELSASASEELVAHYEESGWIWCTNRWGQSGWIPLDNVEVRHG